MTALLLYNYVLVELNKVDAPNILLEDFNYFVNKAINQWINKRYNIYDVNQQTTDDVRVLKATAILEAHKKSYSAITRDPVIDNAFDFMGATYEVELPADYLHLLNCICIYKVLHDPKGCYDKDYQPFPAKRLTADSWSEVLGNYWNLPKYYRPYYYIHNVNLNTYVPTNPIKEEYGTGTDVDYFTSNKNDYTDLNNHPQKVYVLSNKGERIEYTIPSSKSNRNVTPNDGRSNNIVSYNLVSGDTPSDKKLEFKDNRWLVTVNGIEITEPYRFNTDSEEKTKVPESINISGLKKSYTNREAGNRYGNISKVLMEIRYGADDRDFKLEKVAVDYIKTPQHILLTQSQVDRTTDTSLVLEFPDYVCQEILNELVLIILEHNSDRRIETQPIVSLSIANPVQQLTSQPAARAAQNS